VNGDGTTISKCKIRLTGEKAIETSGDDVSIQNCSIRNADGEGIIIDGAAGSIRKCSVYGAITALIVNGDECLIEKNNVRTCVNGAFQVSGAFATIRKNKIEAMPDSTCVNADGDIPTITDNLIEDGSDNSDGILLNNAPTSGLIARNKISGMSDVGIRTTMTTSNIVIEDNSVTDTGANLGSHAFLIQGSGHVLRDNVARRAKYDGFHVMGGNNITLDGNKALDNGEDGIDVQSGTGMVVKDNVAMRNVAEGIENNAVGTLVIDNVAKQNRIDFANSVNATFSANVGGDGTEGGTTAPEIDN
jgi:parallel beta-helix repeat protein